MIGPVFSLLIVVLLAVVLVGWWGHNHPRAGVPTGTRAPSAPGPLDARLAGWVAAGLLTGEQAAAIAAYEQVPETASQPAGQPAGQPVAPKVRGRIPSIAEAFGYLGGMLALAGVVLLVSRYWPHLGVPARLAVSGAAALALLLGGTAVRTGADAALLRLRSLVWLAATGTSALFVVVAVRDAAGVHATSTIVLLAALAVAVESAALWRGLDRPVQQCCLLVAAPVAVGAAVAQFAEPIGPSGLAVLATGALLVGLGLLRRLRAPVLTETVGAVTMIVGALLVVDTWTGAGFLLLVLTGWSLLALAVVPGLARARDDQLALGVISTIGVVQGSVGAMLHFAMDAPLATGVVTGLAGAGLLVVGGRRLVRLAAVAEVVGAVLALVGAAITWGQWHGVAAVLGAGIAVALVTLGVLRSRLPVSLVGSAGLLANVLWPIVWYFPGQGRAPLLTFVSGALILGVAVLLTRGGRGHRGSPRAG